MTDRTNEYAPCDGEIHLELTGEQEALFKYAFGHLVLSYDSDDQSAHFSGDVAGQIFDETLRLTDREIHMVSLAAQHAAGCP